MATGWRPAGLLAVALFLRLSSANAAVTRVDVVSRADLLGGKRFGNAGAYEKLTARLCGRRSGPAAIPGLR